MGTADPPKDNKNIDMFNMLQKKVATVEKLIVL